MSDLSLTPLERAVIGLLLDGSDSNAAVLRKQLAVATVKSRNQTGSGFFTELYVPFSAAAAPMPATASPLGDVEAVIPGLEHGAGFLLYIENGRLAMLEGYSYEEPWPEHINEFTLNHSRV